MFSSDGPLNCILIVEIKHVLHVKFKTFMDYISVSLDFEEK